MSGHLQPLWRIGSLAWTLAFSLSTTLALAQAAPPPIEPPPPIPTPPPPSGGLGGDSDDHLEVGGRYYDQGIGGFREYLEDIQQTQPELYAVLDPELSALERQVLFAWGAGIVGTGAGITLMVIGASQTKMVEGPDGPEEFPDTDMTLLGGGAALVVVAFGVGYLLYPSHSQLLDLVNLHNLSNPPFEMNVSFNPSTGSGYAAVSVDLGL